MGSGERDLKEQLMEAGKALLQPPSSADELLPQLERVGKLLGKVDQSPSKLMLEALSPIIKAVVEEELLRNQNEDVRVAVASCISEITRITAPEAPYDDNQMKEVFQLIVSSFEDLSDKSSHSYSKRTSILETVAKVRSCVVMLDLECDDLIVEMFQHFLKAIRDDHPDSVFSNMETIMTLVLEESEDIGLDIISPLLACLKKDNQVVRPIAQKLAENVIGKCAEKIKPCLQEAKSSMNFTFDDYSTIISTICVETNHAGRDNHKLSGEQLTEGMANGASLGVTTQGDGNKLTAPSDEAPQDQLTKEIKAYTPDGLDHHALVESGPGEDHSTPIEIGPGEDHPVLVETGPGEDTPAPVETFSGQEHPVPVELAPAENLPAPATPSNSATCNGVAENEDKEISVHPRSEMPQHTSEEDQSHDDANAGGKVEPVDSDCGKVAEVEPKSAQISKKRSKRTNRSTKSTVPSESSYTDTDTDKETKRIADGNIKLDKEVHASPSRDPSIGVAVHEENESETEKLSPPKVLESELENVFSPSPSGSKLDEGRLSSRKGGRSKKKNKFGKKASTSEDVATKKATGGTDNSEGKLLGQSGKKAPARDSPAEKIQVPVKPSEVEEGSGSDSDAKLVKTSTRKADTRNHTGDGSSSKKKIDDKKRIRGKTTLEKELMSSPKPSKAVKDDSPLEETPKTSSKRKRAPSKGKATDVKKHGEDLVGTRIKVWWPMDKMFYEGVVDSFDPKNKKHKVTYTDGELEHLNLGEEKWELIKDGDSREDEERETKAGSPDTFPELQKKKKAKTGSEPSATKGKTGSSRDGVSSSSRSKGTAKKSSGKSVDNSKDDGKLAEATPKSSAKSEDAGGKSKARSKKAGGKSTVDASEKAGKTKDEDSDTPKTIVKFKLGSPKSFAKDSEKAAVKDYIKTGSKSNTSKIGSKSSTNGAGKVKSGSAKSKETEDNDKSPEVVKASKSGKSKLADTPKRKQTEGKSDTPKGKETEGKSAKKRRRG